MWDVDEPKMHCNTSQMPTEPDLNNDCIHAFQSISKTDLSLLKRVKPLNEVEYSQSSNACKWKYLFIIYFEVAHTDY